MQIIGQIVEVLNLLLNTTRGEREELVDDYKHQFNTLVELVINIQRIVDGETPYGRQIKWGYHLWQLHTYKRQHGLTLQVGWDDVVDFGIRLGEIIKVVVPRNYSYRPSLSATTGHNDRVNVVSDICEFDCRPRLQRLALHEAAVNLSSQSSSEGSSVNSSESDTVHFDIDNLSTDDLASTSDSIPDLEDHMGLIVGEPWRTRVRRVRAARLRLPVHPAQAWRDLFRPTSPEQGGQPWREVLGFMVNEQQNMTTV